MNAMILAAGLGTRLRPYSLLRPKPLFPVLGQPLLMLLLDRLRAAGLARVVVNAHHLRGQIAALLHGEEGIILQQEESILGTGGGLRQAMEHFGGEPVLVTNGDIYHTVDLAGVLRAHTAAPAEVTMVLHDLPRYNKVAVAADGLIQGFAGEDPGPGGKLLAYTGIQVLDPAVLNLIPPGEFFSIITCYRELIRQGGRVRALVVRDHFWTDMGTPEDYLALHAYLLERGEPGQGIGPGRKFLVAQGAEMGPGVRLTDWAAIGTRARIGADASLTRVVVWDGAEVPAGAQLADTIVT